MIAKSPPKKIVLSYPLGDFVFDPSVKLTLPEFEPTKAAPGSMEKKAVLSERVAKGLPLHHERDHKWAGRMSVSGFQCLIELLSEEAERANLSEEELVPKQEKEDAFCC